MDLSSWLLWMIILIVVWKSFTRFIEFKKYVTKINNLPGPKGVPILGNLWDLIVPYEEFFHEFTKLFKKQQEAGHGVVGLWFVHVGKVVLLKGSSAEVILGSSKHVNKSVDYQFAKGLLGDGLLSSERELWEKRRKMINPSFHVGFLKSFIPMFNEKAAILMELLEKVEEKGPFNVDIYLRYLSLDMLCQSVLGVNADTQRNSDNETVRAFMEVGHIFFKRVYSPWLWPSILYYWTNHRKREVEFNRIIRQFSWKVIQERRKFLEQRKTQQDGCQEDEREDEQICGMKQRRATLDVLLESTCDGKKLMDEEIVDEVVIQIGAGHETTASSMSFSLFILGYHLDFQKKVQEELDHVLGDCDRPLTSDDLCELKFLDAVLKETYRLYPPVPYIAREFEEDVVIDGYTVPAKTTVMCAIFMIHRDPEVFPEPDKFDPERFMGSNGPSSFEYMPFSAGPRNCIGYKMAQTETKIVLAKILRKYDVISHDKPEDLKLVAAPDLRASQGIKISLRRRKTTVN